MTDAELMKLNIEDIPALNCTRKQLCGVSVRIVLELKGFVGKIGETAIKGLIEEICLNYNNVSYHNFTHGFSLMQVIFCLYFRDCTKCSDWTIISYKNTLTNKKSTIILQVSPMT